MTTDGDADDAALIRLTDDQRAVEAAEARRREQWLLRQASEAGSLSGVIRDLAEQAVLVAVSTVAQRSVRGTIVTVGGDFVGLAAPHGERVLVATAAVSAIRTEPGAGSTAGDRVMPEGATLGAVLTDLAADRPGVSLHTLDGIGIAGRLHAVGTDVVTMVGEGGSVTYVPMARVSELVMP